MKDYELSKFAQPFLFRICMMCAYTRPRYQVSVYRTIGPLVCLGPVSHLSQKEIYVLL